MGNKDGEIPTPQNIVTAQFPHSDFCVAFQSVGRQLHNLMSVAAQGIIHVSSSGCASQRFVSCTLSAGFLQLCHYLLLAMRQNERRMYDLRETKSIVHIWTKILTAKNVSTTPLHITVHKTSNKVSINYFSSRLQSNTSVQTLCDPY